MIKLKRVKYLKEGIKDTDDLNIGLMGTSFDNTNVSEIFTFISAKIITVIPFVIFPQKVTFLQICVRGENDNGQEKKFLKNYFENFI